VVAERVQQQPLVIKILRGVPRLLVEQVSRRFPAREGEREVLGAEIVLGVRAEVATVATLLVEVEFRERAMQAVQAAPRAQLAAEAGAAREALALVRAEAQAALVAQELRQPLLAVQ
jgi:signal transduction histidine kinase